MRRFAAHGDVLMIMIDQLIRSIMVIINHVLVIIY